MIATIALTLVLMQTLAKTERRPVVRRNPEPTVAVILGQNPENIVIMRRSTAESLLRPDMMSLYGAKFQARLRPALILALGTTQQCTEGQANAGLCVPGCITWEQHVAEVNSWWAAPERRYVACSDPRVGAPRN